MRPVLVDSGRMYGPSWGKRLYARVLTGLQEEDSSRILLGKSDSPVARAVPRTPRLVAAACEGECLSRYDQSVHEP